MNAETESILRAGYKFKYKINKQDKEQKEFEDICLIYPDEMNPELGQFLALSSQSGRVGRGSSHREAFLELILCVGHDIKHRIKAKSEAEIGKSRLHEERFKPENRDRNSRLNYIVCTEVIDEAREILGIKSSYDSQLLENQLGETCTHGYNPPLEDGKVLASAMSEGRIEELEPQQVNG